MNESTKNNVKVTRGMANMQKHAARKCPQCGLGIGVYVGRYPAQCPDCGTSLRPTVEEQVKLVRSGVAAEDVAWMVTEGVDLNYVQECIDEGAPLEEIIGKFKQAFKQGLAGVKKSTGEFKKAGGELRKSKVARKKKKLKTKVTKAATKEKKAKAKAKKTPTSQRAQKKAARATASRQKAGAKFRKVQFGQKKKPKPTPKKKPAAKPKPSTQNRPTQREAMMDGAVDWSRTPLGPQANAIRKAIGEQITEQGFASLNKIQERFRSNPVALTNFVRQHPGTRRRGTLS